MNYLVQKISEEFSDNFIKFDKDFFKNLREGIADRYLDRSRSSEKFRKNYMKKLSYFIKNVLDKFSDLIKITNEKTKIFYYLYKSLSKQGGNYFRQDSLYVMNRELKILKMEESCNIIGKYI